MQLLCLSSWQGGVSASYAGSLRKFVPGRVVTSAQIIDAMPIVAQTVE